jgi:hypothetical protein
MDIFYNIQDKFINYINIINKKEYFDLWKQHDNIEEISITTSYILTININGIIMKLIVINDYENDYNKYKLLLTNIMCNILNVNNIPSYKITINHLNDFLVVKFKKIMNDRIDDTCLSLYINNLQEEKFYYDIYYDFNFLKNNYNLSYYDICEDINYFDYIM